MSEQMRKEFEEWFFDVVDAGVVAEELCWQAWQASRAAIVVELPDWSEYDTPRQAIDACGRSLKEAGFGVSYK
jgi:hypothetical protein